MMITDKPFPTSESLPGSPSSPSSSPATPSDASATVGSSSASGSTVPSDHFTDTGGGGGNDVLQRVVKGAHETLDRLADSAAPHVQRWQESVGTGAGHVKEIGDEWTESLRCTVRENPLAAVATALALGVLIARLTQR